MRLSTLLSLLIFLQSGNCCFLDQTTWSSDNIFSSQDHITTPEDCQAICLASPSCTGFTWTTDRFPLYPNLCALFSATDELVPCQDCVSGPPTCLCSEKYQCVIQDDNIITSQVGVAREV